MEFLPFPKITLCLMDVHEFNIFQGSLLYTATTDWLTMSQRAAIDYISIYIIFAQQLI